MRPDEKQKVNPRKKDGGYGGEPPSPQYVISCRGSRLEACTKLDHTLWIYPAFLFFTNKPHDLD